MEQKKTLKAIISAYKRNDLVAVKLKMDQTHHWQDVAHM